MATVVTDRVPWRGVVAAGHHDRRLEPGRSAGDCREADGGIIAQGVDRFQGHIAGALDRPFVVLLGQDMPVFHRI